MVRTVILSVPASAADVAADRLWSAGARAVEEREGPLGRTELHSVLAADDSVSLRRLGELPGEWTVRFSDVEEAPAESWRAFAVPIEVNERLVIRPAWLPPGHGVLEVAIEPAGSFGLGDHPTTRLAADLVDRIVTDGDRMLDVGCGSGVLAIIAAARGAEDVVAIDVSDAAIEATTANAAVNGLGERITVSTSGIESIDGHFDLVVANILAPTLVSMAADLQRLTSSAGRLVVSGVLADAHHHVLDALRPMQPMSTSILDGWAAIELRH